MLTSPIRWIISDLDGTLLDSNQQISEVLIQRIRRFNQQGGCFSLATGRTLAGALPYIRKLNLTSPLILYNGAKIYDPIKGRYISEYFLPAETVHYALELYLSIGKLLGLDLLVFYNEHIYCPELTDAVKRHMRKDKVEIVTVSFHWFYEKTDKINKLMFIGPSDAIERFQQITARLNTVQSEPTYLEILPPNINKGIALLQLIEHVHGHADEFAAVGDNLNDLEMIGMLRHGVAVRNAHKRLKEAAAWVTLGSNDEDALGEVIEFAEKSGGLSLSI